MNRKIAGLLLLASWFAVSSGGKAKSGTIEIKWTDGKTEKPESSKSGVSTEMLNDLLEKALAAKEEKTRRKQLQDDLKNNRLKLEPIKCFPKALCGVSSEVARISKRKQNNLVTEYLVLMKAISRNPEFIGEMISSSFKTRDKVKESSDSENEVQDDVSSVGNTSESDEENDDEDGNNSSDSEEYADDLIDNDGSNEDDSDSREGFDKDFVKEKVQMELLMKNTMHKESLDDINLWDDHAPSPGSNQNNNQWNNQDSRPSFWDYFPFSALSSKGSDNGPQPYPGLGPRPWPGSPSYKWNLPDMTSPEDDAADNQSMSGPSLIQSFGLEGISTYIMDLFGFGDSSLSNDPWFPIAARDLSGDISPGIAVDQTREILETAIDIGKSFDQPTQCNEIFNACPFEYTELLFMIDDLRKNIRSKIREAQVRQASQPEAPSDDKPSESGEKSKYSWENHDDEPYKSKNKLKSKKKHKKPEMDHTAPFFYHNYNKTDRYVIPHMEPPNAPTASYYFSRLLGWLGLSSY